MEDKRLENIIHDDPVPRSPREHLARNLKAAELVFDGSYGALVRIYRHTPGVILGLNQGGDDVHRDACEALGYEVVRRPTAGAAVIVDPEQALCYSIFFSSGAIRPNAARLYEGFVLPFAERLSEGIIVDRLFSLIPPGSEHPIAGHAMAHHHDNAVTQIDGIVHLTDPDVQLFSRLLKMRDLYALDERPIIGSHGSYYSKTGRLLTDVDVEALEFERSEYDDIRSFVGVRSLGIAEPQLIRALHGAVELRFGRVEAVDDLEYGDLSAQLERVDELTRASMRWNAQGHCFIDFIKPRS